jgi:hypothetical protein
MDQLRSLMQSALAQRLAEHLRAEIAPVQNIPNLRTASVQDRLVGGLRLGTLAPRDLLDTLGLAREGIEYGAKALTGLGALETQKIQQIDNPVLRNAANAGSFLLPGGPTTCPPPLARPTRATPARHSTRRGGTSSRACARPTKGSPGTRPWPPGYSTSSTTP